MSCLKDISVNIVLKVLGQGEAVDLFRSNLDQLYSFSNFKQAHLGSVYM